MAKLDQFEAALSRIDTATNKIAADLTELKEEVKNAGLDAATEESILGKLDAAATKLEGIGADPADPVPGEEIPSEEEPV